MKPKKTTIHDIAEKLNVTASTVSRALKNNPRISEATKKVVLEMADELNYQPNHIASALRSGKSHVIGIIVPRINRAFFSSVVRGVEEVANSLDYRVVVIQSYEDPEKEVAAVNALLNARVDGIIASLGKNTESFEHYENILKKDIPLVLFDRTTNKLNTSQVVIDDYLGAYKATVHLIEQGCRSIAHFTNYKRVNIYKERYRGYVEALKDHGIPFNEALICESNMQLEDGRICVDNLLQANISFDGIFSASDYSAIGAIQTLKESGLGVPSDVAVVGFSNDSFTSLTEPSMTSIDQFPIEMGEAAAQLFFDMLNAEKNTIITKKTVLQPELIIRNSSLRLQEKSVS